MSTLNPILSLLGLNHTTTRSARGAHFTTARLQLQQSTALRLPLHFWDRNQFGDRVSAKLSGFLDEAWQNLTLQKLRYKLFLIPGELTRPQNRPVLRLRPSPMIESRLSAGIGETRVFIEFPGLGCWSSLRLGGLESESPALFTGFPHCLRLIAAAIPRVSRSLRPGASPDASR